MTKKINEASVRLDVVGLESDDLATLAQILSLAGAAETASSSLSDVGAEVASDYPVQSMSSDEYALPVVDAIPDESPDMGMDSGLDVDSIDVIDASEPVESDDFDEFEVDEVPVGDDEFDMERMSSLAGITESTDGTFSPEGNETNIHDKVDPEIFDEELSEDIDEEDDVIEENLLPDLHLNKDGVQEDVDEVEEYGPFSSEMAASSSAQHETNGVEGDNYIVFPKGNAFFWKRTMQEDVDFRPENCEVSTDGIRNSVHSYKDKGYNLGDNPIIARETVNDDTDVLNAGDDDEEELEKLRESLASRYKKFIGK